MNRQTAGFTLLEVLVALAVLGFVVLGLSQGLRFGVAAWERQSRDQVRRDDLAATDRVLRRLIEQADPGLAGGETPFRGSPGALALRSVLPDPSGLAAPRPVLAAIGVDGGRRLVLRLTPREGGATENLLLGGVDRLELGYWRPGGGWQRDWSLPELPRLVRLRVIFVDAGRHWPDLLVAPMRERLER